MIKVNCVNKQDIIDNKEDPMSKSYSSPRLIIYGDVTELTKHNGNAPPTDGEGTVSGHVSP